ncbi:MAG: hypothetical protein M5U09_13025 [Gammaproteobacteria bacterium]|nr:hypothetical protein [Gammaproteobacteria bacterium]
MSDLIIMARFRPGIRKTGTAGASRDPRRALARGLKTGTGTRLAGSLVPGDATGSYRASTFPQAPTQAQRPLLPAATTSSMSVNERISTPRSSKVLPPPTTLSRRTNSSWSRVMGGSGSVDAGEHENAPYSKRDGQKPSPAAEAVGNTFKQFAVSVDTRPAELVDRACRVIPIQCRQHRAGDIVDMHRLHPAFPVAEQRQHGEPPDHRHHGSQQPVSRAEHRAGAQDHGAGI